MDKVKELFNNFVIVPYQTAVGFLEDRVGLPHVVAVGVVVVGSLAVVHLILSVL